MALYLAFNANACLFVICIGLVFAHTVRVRRLGRRCYEAKSDSTHAFKSLQFKIRGPTEADENADENASL